MADSTTTTNLAKAIHQIQTALLDSPSCATPQLLSAGAILSRPDYDDVVTERSISNLCGYPLCPNPLPTNRPGKGRYRISLKEHRVYDLQETYRFCSEECLVGSKAFEGTLKDERCLEVSSRRVAEMVEEFERRRMGAGGGERSKLLVENGDLGFSRLTIKEKSDVGNGVVSLEQWIGPSNAIEGYAPKQDKNQGLKPKTKPKSEPKPRVHKDDFGTTWKEMEFISDIFIADPFDVADKEASSSDGAHHAQSKAITATKKETVIEQQSTAVDSQPTYNDTMSSLSQKLEDMDVSNSKAKQKKQTLKSSLKQLGAKGRQHSVKWANEEEEKSLVTKEVDLGDSMRSQMSNEIDDKTSERLASAEACAAALLQASEAVTLGEAKVEDAVSETGIIIIPPPHDEGEIESETNESNQEFSRTVEKWPKKPVLLDTDMCDAEDSWHDAPPEGFSLTLSTFATMWMALFGWITCSSLAYVYGRDENSQNEFLYVNGREYPHQIILSDGCSFAIKQTLSGCIARALPQLVSDLRLPTPLSIIENSMAQLLDTMSFVDALPPFKAKEWHVIVLLFIDALSVFRIPGLAKYMVDKRILLHKVLSAAHIGGEEYETMKDLIIPLGRFTSTFIA